LAIGDRRNKECKCGINDYTRKNFLTGWTHKHCCDLRVLLPAILYEAGSHGSVFLYHRFSTAEELLNP
jgi:hypothetical protein